MSANKNLIQTSTMYLKRGKGITFFFILLMKVFSIVDTRRIW